MKSAEFTIFVAALICILLSGCKTQPSSAGGRVSGDIDLSAAILHKQDVGISDIADSITFIPLETAGALIGNNMSISFSPEYIFVNHYCFGWNGKFIRPIGRHGNGPYEEPEGVSRNILFKDGRFYSKGSKFIEYDSSGQPTGKVRNLYDTRDVRSGKWGNDFYAKMVNAAEWAFAGDKFAVYVFPQEVVFIDSEFDSLSIRHRVSKPIEQAGYTHNQTTSFTRYMTYYSDTTLFYNFFNDTIYHVNDKGLHPHWIVHIDPTLKMGEDFFLRAGELMLDAASAWQAGNVENSELIRNFDKKQIAYAAYETDRYLLFPMIEAVNYWNFRNLPPLAPPYFTFLDKTMGNIKSTKAGGFRDDLSGMDTFLPMWGAYDNKLIAVVWPYELHDLVEKYESSGRTVNPLLASIVKAAKPDDNPILVVAHLKK